MIVVREKANVECPLKKLKVDGLLNTRITPRNSGSLQGLTRPTASLTRSVNPSIAPVKITTEIQMAMACLHGKVRNISPAKRRYSGVQFGRWV